MIKTNKMTKSYNQIKAIDEVSLELEKGEILDSLVQMVQVKVQLLKFYWIIYS